MQTSSLEFASVEPTSATGIFAVRYPTEQLTSLSVVFFLIILSLEVNPHLGHVYEQSRQRNTILTSAIFIGMRRVILMAECAGLFKRRRKRDISLCGRELRDSTLFVCKNCVSLETTVVPSSVSAPNDMTVKDDNPIDWLA